MITDFRGIARSEAECALLQEKCQGFPVQIPCVDAKDEGAAVCPADGHKTERSQCFLDPEDVEIGDARAAPRDTSTLDRVHRRQLIDGWTDLLDGTIDCEF